LQKWRDNGVSMRCHPLLPLTVTHASSRTAGAARHARDEPTRARYLDSFLLSLARTTQVAAVVVGLLLLLLLLLTHVHGPEQVLHLLDLEVVP